MTTFYLIRHASNDFFPHTLVGRNPGIHLNGTGQREAEQLAERLAGEGIEKIFSSPMERCRETAEPLAAKCNLNVEISGALNEVDFGDWAGRAFAELDQLEKWKQWNTFRSGARATNGETMFEVQNRVVGFLEKLSRERAGQRIALVSHGDPIRAVILYFLGTPLEFIRRIEISPASVSILSIGDWEAQIRCLNARHVQA
ncbi:MAG TPA: histidine phosphatase family protein [Verrucomicrobiae bacterium]|nr:histidine phosphatase family protein [Verrucomicrobiae bacterium]